MSTSHATAPSLRTRTTADDESAPIGIACAVHHARSSGSHGARVSGRATVDAAI
ncbi:MAG: hypothetical protein R2697_01900 [Ilumatobacteraceae bacterium]